MPTPLTISATVATPASTAAIRAALERAWALPAHRPNGAPRPPGPRDMRGVGLLILGAVAPLLTSEGELAVAKFRRKVPNYVTLRDLQQAQLAFGQWNTRWKTPSSWGPDQVGRSIMGAASLFRLLSDQRISQTQFNDGMRTLVQRLSPSGRARTGQPVIPPARQPPVAAKSAAPAPGVEAARQATQAIGHLPARPAGPRPPSPLRAPGARVTHTGSDIGTTAQIEARRLAQVAQRLQEATEAYYDRRKTLLPGGNEATLAKQVHEEMGLRALGVSLDQFQAYLWAAQTPQGADGARSAAGGGSSAAKRRGKQPPANDPETPKVISTSDLVAIGLGFTSKEEKKKGRPPQNFIERTSFPMPYLDRVGLFKARPRPTQYELMLTKALQDAGLTVHPQFSIADIDNGKVFTWNYDLYVERELGDGSSGVLIEVDGRHHKESKFHRAQDARKQKLAELLGFGPVLRIENKDVLFTQTVVQKVMRELESRSNRIRER